MIYGAVVTAAAVILARLDLRRDAVLALAVVPVLAAHFVHPNEYLYEQYAPRTEALAKTAALPAVVLNNAGYDVHRTSLSQSSPRGRLSIRQAPVTMRQACRRPPKAAICRMDLWCTGMYMTQMR